MTKTDSDTIISLLWPQSTTDDIKQRTGVWTDQAYRDLGIDKIVAFFASDRQTSNRVRSILMGLCQDPAVIRYRQDVVNDLLALPELVAGLRELQSLLSDLDSYRMTSTARGFRIEQLAWRLGQLELYVDVVQKLSHLLNPVTLKATGWCRLRDYINHIMADDTFQQLAIEIPKLMSDLRGASSVTIGVNLDSRLRPEAATLLSINTQKFEGQSLLDRLFGRQAVDETFRGITQLHSKGAEGGEVMLRDLLRDLDRILSDTTKGIASRLDRFIRVQTNTLSHLAFELVFYLGAIRLQERIAARGLSLCQPKIAAQSERVATFNGLYDLNLALRMCEKETEPDLNTMLVSNDVVFGEIGRIFILTGPNQGGKTTYTQAVGLAQLLAQAGLPIPGIQAEVSPVDGILTHFPVEEKPGLEAGRFGEEARRLQTIFQHATQYSLILMNESLASTSEGESLYLAQDIVKALSLLGVRAIFATHLHTLAEMCEKLNTATQGASRLISMVSRTVEIEEDQIDEGKRGIRRTYKVEAGPPLGISYARDIASQYGISLDKILETLQARAVISPDSVPDDL